MITQYSRFQGENRCTLPNKHETKQASSIIRIRHDDKWP
jgi:hypothetical protein